MKPVLWGFPALALLFGAPALAQESVQKKLDECIVKEQSTDSTAGAVLGFLSHFSISRTTTTSDAAGNIATHTSGGGNNNAGGLSTGQAAVAGGAMGLATAYYNAMKDCLEDHPDWLPAAQLSTTADYQAAVAQAGYEASQGVVIRPEAITMPEQARPDTHFQMRTRFLVLTPDGAEAAVYIARKLYAVADGSEQELTIPAPPGEKRTLSAGEHEDVVNLVIPKDAPLGVAYRVEFIVGAPRRTGTTLSATIKVL
ncbi:MAG: hypothetical protein JO224_05220 [Pelomonas sp.]|nr:hypothetical protein [Roseateles sp.]